MRIAVPNEVQDNENRVGMTPDGARTLVEGGHEVLIETEAGAGAGFPDDDYREVGAEIAPDAGTAWGEGELVVKVKQPTEAECELFRRRGAFFGYTHTESRPWLAEAFLEREMTAISFERVRLDDGSLPLLAPMSRIAGHMSVLIGTQLLQTVNGGPGVLVGDVPGAGPTGVAIIGGGVVGQAAAKVALSLNASVTIFELRGQRRAELSEALPAATVEPPNEDLVARSLAHSLLLVNGAPILEGADEHVVTRRMVRDMPDGAVIVDVTAEIEGAIETSVRKTTHSDPTFVEEGVTHYVVPNIPGVVPRTSALSLEDATLPYTVEIASLGVGGAIAADPSLAAGVLCHNGDPVADDIAAMAD
jgi:alanine dehydrogenase